MNLIYFKNIDIHKINIEKILNKYEHKKRTENVFLTNKGLLKYIDHKLYLFDETYNLKDETNEHCLVHKTHTKNQIFQIPILNKPIVIIKYIFSISHTTQLIIEIYNEKIHDFYMSTRKNENLNHFFINEEISYIQKMLI